MEKTNISKEKDNQDIVYEFIIHRIETRMNERIFIGTFGAMRTNDESTRGYCIVKWVSEPCTVPKNTIMKGVETP